MTRKMWLASGSALALTTVGLTGAAPPPPIANYWVSASTESGMGSGMGNGMGSGGPAGMAAMMAGGGNVPSRTLRLQLGSRQPGAALDVGDHQPPAGLGVGASLPLRGSLKASAMPGEFQRPSGRMLVYWGCGEHVGPGQPLVIDFAKMAAGQMPPGWGAMVAGAMPPQPRPGRGYGEWPNDRDSRSVPASGSLVGAHSVRSTISPPIAFSLNAGQDFMPSLDLGERGSLPSGAARLGWRPAPTATGYALSLMGAAENGGNDMILWSSSRTGGLNAMGLMDYLPPARVRQMIASGQVLSPATSECVLPTEVARAAPSGFVRMIGFGPEFDFAEAPRAPKWVAKVRFKSSASLIRGMDMSDGDGASGGRPGPTAKPKKPSWRDLLKGVVRPPLR